MKECVDCGQNKEYYEVVCLREGNRMCVVCDQCIVKRYLKERRIAFKRDRMQISSEQKSCPLCGKERSE